MISRDDSGCATIDTGCQRMAIGLNTLKKLQETQPSELPITFRNEKHQFRSVHKVSCTNRLACIPCSLGPRGCVLRPAVFEEEHSSEAPFLLSLPFLLHCQATLVLDEDSGLALVSNRFAFKVQCHLGPTGALRIPIQQFTTLMMRHLVEQLDYNTDEYEVLQTELQNRTISAVEPVSASCDRTRIADFSPISRSSNFRDPQIHGGAIFEARSQRANIEPPSLAGLGSNGAQGSATHRSGDRAPCFRLPEDAETSRSTGTSNPGDGHMDGNRSAGSAGWADGRTTSRTSSTSGGSNTFGVGMVQSFSTNTQSATKRDAADSRVSATNYVGSSGDSGSEPGTNMSLRRPGHDLHFQDCKEPGQVVLEVPQSTRQTVQLLPMAGASGTSTSSSSRCSTPELGVHQEESAGGVPSSHHYEGRIECIHRPDDMQEVRKGASQGEEEQATTSASDTEGIPNTDAGISASGDRHDAQGDRGVEGVREMERCKSSAPTDRGGVASLHHLAGASAAEPGNFESECAKETKSRRAIHVNDLRPGLRRHIYGCLKRSEACWLDIHNLLCNTPETDQERHLETTCKVIRQSLQLQQPAMKHFAELYLLQPKQLKTVAEVCNPKRFADTTDAFGLKAGQSFDLELSWNLLEESQQQAVKEYIKTERPGLTICYRI